MSNSIYVADLKQTLSMRSLIWHRALMDVKARYKRTLIGPFWTSLSMAIFIISFGFIGAHLWGSDVSSYMPFFCAGYMTWILISTIITESRVIFSANREILLSTPVPIHVFVFELVIRNYVVFAHHMLVYACVLLFFLQAPEWPMLLMIPGLLLIFIVSIAFGAMWSIACTRYQDLGQLSQNLLQIIFFVTPIMWPADRLNGTSAQWLVDLNPMYHFVQILRAPMLGEIPSLYSYVFCIICCALFTAIAAFTVNRLKHRIVFWI